MYLANLASYILGEGGFGSRLMEEVRVKKGLAYSVNGSFSITQSSSSFSGALQTKNSSGDEAIKIVQSVVEDFVKNGVTQEELDLAKQFIVGSQPLRNEKLSSRLTRAGNEYYNNRALGEWKTELEKTKNVTVEELNTFIKSHPEITKLSFSVVTKKESK
jgi:predicted Zn-dependent peptidase